MPEILMCRSDNDVIHLSVSEVLSDCFAYSSG